MQVYINFFIIMSFPNGSAGKEFCINFFISSIIIIEFIRLTLFSYISINFFDLL